MRKLWLSILAVMTVFALLVCSLAEMPDEPILNEGDQVIFTEQVDEIVPEEDEFLLEDNENALDGDVGSDSDSFDEYYEEESGIAYVNREVMAAEETWATVYYEDVIYKVVKPVQLSKTPFASSEKAGWKLIGSTIHVVEIVKNSANNMWLKTDDGLYIFGGYRWDGSKWYQDGDQYVEYYYMNTWNEASWVDNNFSGKTVEYGKSYALQGTITSNYTMKSITARFFDGDTALGTAVTVDAGGLSYSVYASPLDRSLKFATLPHSNNLNLRIAVTNYNNRGQSEVVATVLRYSFANQVTESTDKMPPSISGIKISDVSSDGYTVTCNVSDNVGIARVSFPTWTINNGQDDLFTNWPETAVGTYSNGTATYRVNVNDHNNETGCDYITHIYAYDTSGNVASIQEQNTVYVPSQTIPVTDVSINQTTLSLIVGDTANLTASISPSNATNKNVLWTSSDTGVVLVDANGNLAANGVGSATITVTADGDKKAICNVTVAAKPAPAPDPRLSTIFVTGVSFETTSISLPQSGTRWLIASVSPSNATNQKVTYSTSNIDIAYVDSNGILYGVGPGTATITATSEDGGKKATCTVTVTKKIPEFALTQKGKNGTTVVNIGENLQLVPAFATSAGVTVTSYKSSKSKVVTVDANGLVTAVAEGKAKITVKTSNKKVKATITVKVVDPYKPTGVSIAQGKTITVNVGEPLQLSAALAPATAQSGLTWKSSKAKVAAVDANGLVTPKAEGKAKITVTTRNKKKAKITVKVVDPYKPTGVSIAQGKVVTLHVNDTLQLNATLAPATAQSDLKWKSSKKKVASVDANGVVTAKKKGTAKITVTTKNKKKATIIIKVLP